MASINTIKKKWEDIREGDVLVNRWLDEMGSGQTFFYVIKMNEKSAWVYPHRTDGRGYEDYEDVDGRMNRRFFEKERIARNKLPREVLVQ